ncbi:hypothetical protein RND81_01G158000 [Saponaria officinalis]|uniref:Peptidase A1 domain-containing protein n=1 Tax=Saponaria officinalis TaxID=3572 RepID=A0AAW1NFS4_SAPOF
MVNSQIYFQCTLDTKIPNGLTLKMIHRDLPDSPIYRANLTDKERMKNYIKMSGAKVKFHEMSVVSKNKSSISIQPNRATIRPTMTEQYYQYMIQVRIGTFENEYPTSKLHHLNVDTGGGLIWTQCEAAGDKHFYQVDPLYPAYRSSTYQQFSCNNCPPDSKCKGNVCIIELKHDYNTKLSAIAAVEVFTLATEGGHSQSFSNIIFGCGIDMQDFKEKEGNFPDNKVSGTIGMGYGFYGFMEQTQLIFGGIFSYCLQPIITASYSSPITPMYLRFGNDALPQTKTGWMSTPVYRYQQSTSYYLILEAISVDSWKLNIDPYLFRINDDGSGGFVIDSGTTLTYIMKRAYLVFKLAIRNFIKQNNNNVHEMRKPELGYDLCYTRAKRPKTVNVPTVTFHFSNNADYVIPTTDTFFVSTSSGHRHPWEMYCMNFLPSDEMSYLGVFHHANKRIIYDTRNSLLHFKPADCSLEN